MFQECLKLKLRLGAHARTNFKMVFEFQVFQECQHFQQFQKILVATHFKSISRDSKRHHAFQELQEHVSRGTVKTWLDFLMHMFTGPCSVVHIAAGSFCLAMGSACSQTEQVSLMLAWILTMDLALWWRNESFIALHNYHRLCYGTWPKGAHSALINGDHPQLDTSEPLNEDDKKIYLHLIGALQWVNQIGRFGVTTSVMTLSWFQATPKKVISTMSRESMGVFPRCAMLQKRSGLTHHLII